MEGLDIPSFVFGSTSLRPPKVSSKDEIYSARWKLRLISDQAKGGSSMSPFQPLVYIQDLSQIDCVRRETFQCDDFCGESESFTE